MFRLNIPFVCKDVGSDEPEYCKTCPLALPSRRTVKLSLSLADSINLLASFRVMPSTTEWLLIFNNTSPSWTLLSPPFVPSLMNILLPKTIPKSKRNKIHSILKVYYVHTHICIDYRFYKLLLYAFKKIYKFSAWIRNNWNLQFYL